jgi:hypothetical protein
MRVGAHYDDSGIVVQLPHNTPDAYLVEVSVIDLIKKKKEGFMFVN